MHDAVLHKEAKEKADPLLNDTQSTKRNFMDLTESVPWRTSMIQGNRAASAERQLELESDFIGAWPTRRDLQLPQNSEYKKYFVKLVQDSTKNVDGIDTKGNTFLHNAVLLLSVFDDTDDDLYVCIDMLMCRQKYLNIPNKNGYTAIGWAVHHFHKRCIELMLKHASAHRLYLDCYPGYGEHTVRELIVQTYPDLQPLLPAPILESLDTPDRNKRLLAALQHDEYDIFHETLQSTHPNPWYHEPYYSRLLEIACQIMNRSQFVTLLLTNGANPNTNNIITGIPLLHATVRSGNFELLQLLLKEWGGVDVSLKDNEERTLLHWLAWVSERAEGDKQRIENCLKNLLGSYCNINLRIVSLKKGIDGKDNSGNSVLYCAVERGFNDRAKVLLTGGADVREFERGSKILLSASLSLLEEILDDCLVSNDKPVTSKDIKLTLNDKLLSNIVPRMQESQYLRNVLRHPVLTTFLNLKWQKLRVILFLDLAFYVTFLLSFTTCILGSQPYNTTQGEDGDKDNVDPLSSNDSNMTSSLNDRNFTTQLDNSSLIVLWYVLTVLIIMLTFREVFQLIIYRLDYIKSLENWLEIFLIISTFISYSGVVQSVDAKTYFSAVAILLGWLEL